MSLIHKLSTFALLTSLYLVYIKNEGGAGIKSGSQSHANYSTTTGTPAPHLSKGRNRITKK